MIEIPTGSLIGLCIVCAVVGLVLGRSGRFMSKVARGHQRVHSDADASASVDADVRTGEQNVTVVVNREEVAATAPGTTAALVAEFLDEHGRLTIDDARVLTELHRGWRGELSAAGFQLVPIEAADGGGLRCIEVRSSELVQR